MKEILTSLGIEDSNLGGFCGEWMGSGPELAVTTPIDGSQLATVREVTEEEYDAIVSRAHEAFLHWRTVPAPRRGELVRAVEAGYPDAPYGHRGYEDRPGRL